MEIRLKLLTFGKFDTKSVEIADNDKLKVLFDCKLIDDWNYVAILRNGQKMSILVKNGEFEIPKELLTNGTLNVIIETRANGETVRTYQCEPLIIKVLDGKVEVIPEIAKLEADAENFKKLYYEMNGKVQELEKQCNNLLEVVIELNKLKKEID